jgi:hypothetical protein
MQDMSELENLLSEQKEDVNKPISKKMEINRNGKKFDIEISFKKLSYVRYKFIRKSCTQTRKGIPDMDFDKYRLNIVTECLTDPSVGKASLMENFKAISPEDCLVKMFSAGEITKICDIILEASGFETDPFRESVQDDEEVTE